LQKESVLRISKSKQVVRILGYEPLSVQNAITEAKAKSGSGAYIWEVMGIKEE